MVALNVLTTLIASSPTGSLEHACGREPGVACQLIWDISHDDHLARVTRTFFAGPVQVVLRILFVVLLAVAVRYAASRLIRRVTVKAAASSENGTGSRTYALLGERRQQRATALGSVLGNAASVTIFTIAAFIILGDLGLNLAPVLASAGVIGIAIGFGAQNLVQDFLAGIFMLLEDQYGVGDVINIDDVSGTVEAVSLRITRVRDVNGVIWHIRNGTISKSGNESHGWARAVIDYPVSPDLDIIQVRSIMDRTGEAMWLDPAWHDVILERPEVWGVQDVTSDAVLVRIIARTAPLRQWEVGRELRELLKVALAQLAPATPEQLAGLPPGTAPDSSAPAGAEPPGSVSADDTPADARPAGTKPADAPPGAAPPSQPKPSGPEPADPEPGGSSPGGSGGAGGT
jgi:moderate conductance mechanosensitive channel